MMARRLQPVNDGNERAASARALMLACKATTCNWDVLGAAMYVERGRTGRTQWVQRIRCTRCGSIRLAHYPPHRTRTRDRIGGYKYERPPGWAEIALYYGDAMQAMVDEGIIVIEDGPLPE